jgi:hypothetical protein
VYSIHGVQIPLSELFRVIVVQVVVLVVVVIMVEVKKVVESLKQRQK